MRVAGRRLDSVPWFLKPFFWNQRRTYGQPLESALIWARRPPLFMAVALLYGALDRKRSAVSPVIRSLVTVRVSQINHCRFCVDLNSMTLARRAGSMDKVKQLDRWRDSAVFAEQERAALDYAEAVTYSDREVTDELVERLRKFWEDDGIVELTALIAFQNLSSKFNAALDVPPQGFCEI